MSSDLYDIKKVYNQRRNDVIFKRNEDTEVEQAQKSEEAEHNYKSYNLDGRQTKAFVDRLSWMQRRLNSSVAE